MAKDRTRLFAQAFPRNLTIQGGCSMISEGGFKLIKLLYLQNAAPDQSLHCLPLAKQFYTHSQVVKWTC